MDEVQTTRNKMYRGQVVKTLGFFYPDPMTVEDLKGALIARGISIAADTVKVLHYLADKEYIRIKEGGSSEFKDDDIVHLTAKGIDLLESTIIDPGVIL